MPEGNLEACIGLYACIGSLTLIFLSNVRGVIARLLLCNGCFLDIAAASRTSQQLPRELFRHVLGQREDEGACHEEW